MARSEFALITYDFERRVYEVHRPDMPGVEWQEISFGAACDLGKQLYRYVQDFYNEKNGTNLP